MSTEEALVETLTCMIMRIDEEAESFVDTPQFARTMELLFKLEELRDFILETGDE